MERGREKLSKKNLAHTKSGTDACAACYAGFQLQKKETKQNNFQKIYVNQLWNNEAVAQ